MRGPKYRKVRGLVQGPLTRKKEILDLRVSSLQRWWSHHAALHVANALETQGAVLLGSAVCVFEKRPIRNFDGVRSWTQETVLDVLGECEAQMYFL